MPLQRGLDSFSCSRECLAALVVRVVSKVLLVATSGLTSAGLLLAGLFLGNFVVAWLGTAVAGLLLAGLPVARLPVARLLVAWPLLAGRLAASVLLFSAAFAASFAAVSSGNLRAHLVHFVERRVDYTKNYDFAIDFGRVHL